nr:QueT transporter family protein [Thermogladius sp.]
IGYLELELVFSQPSWTFLAVFSSELIIILLFGSLIVKFAERMGL